MWTEEAVREEPINWVTMAGSVFTLVNSALSASLLTLPFAFKKAGIVLAFILILGFGALGRFIDWRLVRYGKRFKANSYASMIAAALGDRVGIFLASLISISLFVGLVGLLILVGDLVTPIMQYWLGTDSVLANRTALTLVVSILFIIPLGTLPNVEMLQYSSFLTVVSLIFMSIAVMIRCAGQVGLKYGVGETAVVASPVLWNWSWEVLRAPPIVWYNSGFIFQSIPTLATNPAQFTKKRLIGVVATVTFIVSALMVTLGLSGYLTFYNNTNGNLLTNYAMDDPLMGVCRALVTVVVVCSYPLFNMPLRESIFYLFGQWKLYRAHKAAETAHATSAEPMQDISNGHPLSDDSSTSAWHSDDTNITHSASSDEMGHVRDDADLVKLDLDATPTPQSDLSDSMQNLDSAALGPASGEISTKKVDQQAVEFIKESPYAVWMRAAIQTVIAWALAFSLAYIIPDITYVIGFVGSTFSPIYYFALPGFVALSLPERKRSTRIGAYFLFACCAYFLIAGFCTYALPKNKVIPALPSWRNATSTA